MGSRYEINLLRNVTIDEFTSAYAGGKVVGNVVAGPGLSESGVTIAEFANEKGRGVIVFGAPMETSDHIDALLARSLGAELLSATVRDIVSTYSLVISGPDVDRQLYLEESFDGEGLEFSEYGERLAEEPDTSEYPDWEPLHEAYIQEVFMARTGIDPGYLKKHELTWYAFEKPTEEAVTATEPATPETVKAPETTNLPGIDKPAKKGFWSKFMR